MSAISRVDSVNFKIWTFSIACNILSFLNLIIFVFISHFPGKGFPCDYYNIVDLNNLNLTQYNAIHHLTPQLFVAGGQMIVYVAQTIIVFAMLCGYFLFCWYRMYTRKNPGSHVNQTTRDIATLGDSTSSFLLTVSMDTFQFFIMTLTYRLPALMAFTCTLFFISFTVLTIRLITQYRSAEQTVFALTKIHPRLQGTIKFKTFVANSMDGAMALNGVILALTLGLALGNSFYVSSATIVFCTLNFFAILLIIYFIIIETVLHHYMKINFGFHLGVACALAVLAYPIVRYETIYASDYSLSINLNLTAIALIWLIFLAIRTIRFFIRRQKRQYKVLSSNEEVKRLTQDSSIVE